MVGIYMLLSYFSHNKEFNFREYISNFNRALNVAKHFRTIGGKRIPVKGHKRTVMRLRSALEDLKATDIERAYMINPRTGKVSQKVEGLKTSVSPTDIMKLKDTEQLGRLNRAMLHNHPGEASLSIPDLQGAKLFGKPVFAVTPSGSVFRASLKKEIPKPLLDNISKTFKTYVKVDPVNVADYVKGNPEQSFLLTHSVNRYLHDKGYIHYRSKLSPINAGLWDKEGERYYKTISKALDSGENIDKVLQDTFIPKKNVPIPRSKLKEQRAYVHKEYGEYFTSKELREEVKDSWKSIIQRHNTLYNPK